MKVVLLISLAASFCLYSASAHFPTSLLDYTQQVYGELDRQYAPLTKEMCENDPEVRSLKSCILQRRNKDLLRRYSDTYLRYPINYWQRVESTDSVGGLSNYINSILSGAGLSISLQKRSVETSGNIDGVVDNEIDSNEEVLRRSKRDIPGNPCMTGKAKRTTVFFGVDSETGGVVELFQNPDQRMYQTFYTRKCSMRAYYSLRCEVTYVEYLTAVFERNSYNVISRPVKIPTGCSLAVR